MMRKFGFPAWLQAAGIVGILCFVIAIWITAVTESVAPTVDAEPVYAAPPADTAGLARLAILCQGRARLDRMVEATNQLIAESRNPPAYRPTVSEAFADVERQKLAKEFLAVLSMPQAVRVRAEPCLRYEQGEEIYLYLDDNLAVEAEIRYLLRTANATLEDIGVTEEGLREILRIGLKAEVHEAWRRYVLDRASWEDVGYTAGWIAYRAVCRRQSPPRFTPADLDLKMGEFTGCRGS